jgi:hypothetical protein
VENEAWIFRVDDTGTVQWMSQITGTSPVKGSKSSDNCLSLTYSQSTGQATALIQTKSPELRQQNPADNTDFTLITFNSAGNIVNALSVTFGNGNSNLIGFPNNLFQVNDYQFIVAGMSNGYATKN